MSRAQTEADRLEAIYSTEWLTPEQAGALAGDVSASTVRGWIRDGDLPALPVSRPGAKVPRYKIRRADLLAWIEGRMTTGEGEADAA